MAVEWGDSRLNEFSKRVDTRLGEISRRQDTLESRINGMPAKVENLTQELATVKRELTSPEGAVGRLAKKIDEMIGNPIAERRQRAQALLVNAFLILGTGLVTYLLYTALGVGR